MNAIVKIFSMLLVLLVGSSCCSKKKLSETTAQSSESSIMEAQGIIKAMENGKDGYTALLQDTDGKSYRVIISIVNMNKSGSKFERFAIGDYIWVKGEFWKDQQNNIFIKAEALKKSIK